MIGVGDRGFYDVLTSKSSGKAWLSVLEGKRSVNDHPTSSYVKNVLNSITRLQLN